MKKDYIIYKVIGFIALIFFIKTCASFMGAVTSGGSDRCSYPESVEEVTNCIEGVWVSSPSGELWKKIVFKDSMYKMYSASPSSGRWSNNPSRVGSYLIKEKRFIDTGKKYTTVFLNNSGVCDYQITFDNGVPYLYCGSNPSRIKKGDENPWD